MNPVQDLEVKDPHLIFERVWSQLEHDLGRANLLFPKEIFWLNGAPGAGKGTNTRYIMRLRDLTAPAVTVSELLQSPEARKRIDAGLLVGDREVTELVFRRLLDPEYRIGAIVDGYPRTKVQVECVKLLYNRLREMYLSDDSAASGGAIPFHKPQFHIIVLFIDEQESVLRQLNRGHQMILQNEKVRESGVGEVVEVRKTDLNDEAARGRYRTFKEITYGALTSLREIFHYHFIDAQGSIAEVQARIVEELRYQSSLELDEATHRRLGALPIASQVVVHARQELVNRLDAYERSSPELFARVVDEIERAFIPVVRRHAISGMALVNTGNELFFDPLALDMLVDVFSERGFHAVVDERVLPVSSRVDLSTGEIEHGERRLFRVRINFGGTEIRRSR